MSKNETCTCKVCKSFVFIVKYANLWSFCCFRRSLSWLLKLPSLAPRKELIVFAYQIWKPQFLSVVQFPFDNCHSPFSPTTCFEIGVYSRLEMVSDMKFSIVDFFRLSWFSLRPNSYANLQQNFICDHITRMYDMQNRTCLENTFTLQFFTLSEKACSG